MVLFQFIFLYTHDFEYFMKKMVGKSQCFGYLFFRGEHVTWVWVSVIFIEVTDDSKFDDILFGYGKESFDHEIEFHQVMVSGNLDVVVSYEGFDGFFSGLLYLDTYDVGIVILFEKQFRGIEIVFGDIQPLERVGSIWRRVPGLW